nr:FAD-dependent oxidoreductase [Candidatus Sigynarchaeota archaeon]
MTPSDKESTYHEPARDVPVAGAWDVIVVGGSQSGVAAAVCAARLGAKVLLVERNCFLGGQSITSLVLQWEKSAYVNSKGYLVTDGIAREMLDRITRNGTSDKLWDDPPLVRYSDGDEWLDSEAIKIVLLEMCIEAGVELLFDSLVIDVMTAGTSAMPRVTGVIVQNRSGLQALKSEIVVDASAYLDVVNFATGGNGVIVEAVDKRMAPGWFTEFRGIDSRAFIEHLIASKDCNGYPDIKDAAKVREHLETGRLMIYHGFGRYLDKASDAGLLDAWPERMELPFRLTVKSWNRGVIKDRWCMVLDRGTKDAIDAWALSRSDIDRQRVDWILLSVFRQVPGWENAYISRTSTRLGLRDTRRLKAVTMETRDSVFNPDFGRHDAIGLSDGHDTGRNRLDRPYPIPYGVLVPEKLDGVLCASRAVGVADHTALDAHRGLTVTIVVGQAAGTAAALAVKGGVRPRDLDVQKLRDSLRKNGVVLETKKIV